MLGIVKEKVHKRSERNIALYVDGPNLLRKEKDCT